MHWLVSHLTEDERWETVTCIKRLETDQGDKEAEDRMRELLAKAEARGNARSASVREESYQKHSRAEVLRSMGRVLTGAEHDELVALNAWFEKFRQEPRTLAEQLEQGAKQLEANPWLSWVEGLDADPVVDRIVVQLSHEERHHLSGAILAFDKANAAPDAVLTSSPETLADLPAEQRAVIEKVRHLSRENERGGE